MALLLVSTADAGSPQPREGRLPRFADYPTAVYHGGKAPLSLTEKDQYFKRAFLDDYDQKVNFVGHYVVNGTPLGCCGDVPFILLGVDFRTGKAFYPDVDAGEELTDCSPAYLDSMGHKVGKNAYFKPYSRLIVITGHMPGIDCGIRYYVETGGKTKLIREVHLEKSR